MFGMFSPSGKSPQPQTKEQRDAYMKQLQRRLEQSEHRHEKLIQDCAALLLKGDRHWTTPLYGLGLDPGTGLDMERAAIAEAFKALNKKEPA